MTAFGLVMLGKLVFLVVLVSFVAAVASLRLNPASSLSVFNLNVFFFFFFLSFTSSNEYQMFVGQNSFILEGRKVALAERRRHND